MMLTRTVLGLAALMMAGAPALAQDGPIASARPVDTTDVQIRQYLDAASAAPTEVEGDGVTTPLLPPDRKPHGEFGVGIGTNGYREAYASTVVPVGDVGTAAIAVSDTRFNGRFGPQKRQSVAVAVNLGDAARTAAPCLRERPSNGLQPLWVTRMRADQLASSGAACAPAR
jgi:hypothetical protein